MSGAGNEQHRETAEPGAAALPSAWAGFVRIRCMKTRTSVVLLLLLAATSTFAESESRVVYLANEGVAVFHNQTTLLFDPIFITKDAYYAAVPDDVRDAIISGAEPYTDIAAVFVSHYHLDHFEPAEMLRLMMQHEKTELYAPKQAVDAMREVAHSEHADIFSRISVLDLAYGDEPKSIQAGNLKVQGFYVPHSGWPKTSSDIENIAFRVTIDDVATVVHLGDADTDKAHFTAHQHHWQERTANIALPPYWFFYSSEGNEILDTFIQPSRAVGIHVPSKYQRRENIPEELREFDLFTKPGETRPLLSTPE